MRILSVVGARPQFVKAAPFSAAVRKQHQEFLVHTGQHYDAAMSDVFFKQLGIPEPDMNLGVGSGGHAEQTAAMLVGLEGAMIEQKPDWVLVYGDTNSTLAGALAAAKLHLPVAHAEAGLRSFNRQMPEEVNRVMTDHLSSLLFCPTETAVHHLAHEGIVKGVVLTGDIMVDSLTQFIEVAQRTSTIQQQLKVNSPYAVATIHRAANTDSCSALSEIMAALSALPIPVIFPVHPRTRKSLDTFQIELAENVQLCEPLSYLDMLRLTGDAAVVVTDSGGLQKEAYILNIPCVTVRTETEWVETVESGWNRLVETQRAAIVAGVEAALGLRPSTHPNFYGDGHAAEKMVAALEAA
jgi:UDP-N-acetylglucosamine 2-epimerase